MTRKQQKHSHKMRWKVLGLLLWVAAAFLTNLTRQYVCHIRCTSYDLFCNNTGERSFQKYECWVKLLAGRSLAGVLFGLSPPPPVHVSDMKALEMTVTGGEGERRRERGRERERTEGVDHIIEDLL